MLTDKELEQLRKKLFQVEDVIAQQRENMKLLGLSKDQIDYVIQPCLCFRDQLQEELDSHKK